MNKILLTDAFGRIFGDAKLSSAGTQSVSSVELQAAATTALPGRRERIVDDRGRHHGFCCRPVGEHATDAARGPRLPSVVLVHSRRDDEQRNAAADVGCAQERSACSCRQTRYAYVWLTHTHTRPFCGVADGFVTNDSFSSSALMCMAFLSDFHCVFQVKAASVPCSPVITTGSEWRSSSCIRRSFATAPATNRCGPN
jgi:hypothetical protein